MNSSLRVVIVGPLPPPSGGMANQTRQLARLLEEEGVDVTVVQTNPPYRPAWTGSLRGVRALFRLVSYFVTLLAASGRADVVHVMANSGWSWHLFAVPAILSARLRRTPVLVNYRGGLAREFLHREARTVRRIIDSTDALVVPSQFLKEIFGSHQMIATVIPNVVDVTMYAPVTDRDAHSTDSPVIVVARNLEYLYGNDTAIRALAVLRRSFQGATLMIAGSGPDFEPLRRLARELGVDAAVRFTGRLDATEMVSLYHQADLVLNPSRADNTPNSVLEALACGIPVVSTDVGGVPYLVQHARTAWLVPADEPEAMADGIATVLSDANLRATLTGNGVALARGCSWQVVREQWLGLYRELAKARSDRHGLAPTVD